MTLKIFFKFVDIKLKLISLTSLSIGTFYCLYKYSTFNVLNFFVLSLTVLSIDMSTSALENYIRFMRRKNEQIFIELAGMKKKTSQQILQILFSLSIISSVFLFFNSNSIVMIMGIVLVINSIKFALKSISLRFSLSEIIYCLITIFTIFFLAVYVHIYDSNIIFLSNENGIFSINFFLYEIMGIVILSLPTLLFIMVIFVVKNILNNSKTSLGLFKVHRNILIIMGVIYIVAYFFICVLVIMGYVSSLYLASLVSVVKVHENFKKFSIYKNNSQKLLLAYENVFYLNNINLFVFTIILLIQDYMSKG